jgi:hypothetical protein
MESKDQIQFSNNRVHKSFEEVFVPLSHISALNSPSDAGLTNKVRYRVSSIVQNGLHFGANYNHTESSYQTWRLSVSVSIIMFTYK